MGGYDIIIIGGGLAGLTAALHLTQNSYKVLVIEKEQYPNHKVCGEYVSNEVKPYLKSLGVKLDEIPYASINKLQLTTISGAGIATKLPLGGFGVSRHALDYSLYKTAINKKVTFLFQTVIDVHFNGDTFQVHTSDNQCMESKWVIGAHGKRSGLDKKINRKFITNKSPWLGVKCHYEHKTFPDDLVALHNFKGGYGGLSKTENGHVNFCYLTTYESFKSYKDIKEFNDNVVTQNPFLKEFLEVAVPVFEKPISIAQISFEKKSPVENHILMCGDSAGLIHPLCGNGMAMGIHAAKIASECILNSGENSRAKIEAQYSYRWKREFANRLWFGRQLQRILMNESASNLALKTITKSEKLLQSIIRRTHGKAILV